MSKIFKTAVLFLFVMHSQQFFAQQTVNQNEELEQKRIENDLKKTCAEYQRKLDDKISDLKKQLKDTEAKKKNLSKSESKLKSTREKIDKMELANLKIEKQISTSAITDEEIQKQRIKTKENDVNIQKLKLTQISQQKELENAINALQKESTSRK
ncbi:hypothetical protein [Flavobacterium gelatinilyticum]|uniref:hypothetical protein n=1 Tax=Flavobacterium gelatinilyticum TaxID=3003260 RepID=UPI00248011E8|nr:hypothetical protein [Flavobacterium gelatinilyticum]